MEKETTHFPIVQCCASNVILHAIVWLYLDVCVLSHFSRVQICVTLWTTACQAPLSIGFSRQEYCSGIVFFCLGFVDLLENQFSSNLQNFSHFFSNIVHHTSFSISYLLSLFMVTLMMLFFFPCLFPVFHF